MIKKIFSLCALILSLGNILYTQAMEQEVQAFCKRHFAQPKNLEKAKKLTPQIQSYLEKLQTAASVLDTQTEYIVLAASIAQLNHYRNKSSEAFNTFKPQSLILADKSIVTDEKLKADDIVNFIPQTSEACVIYLRYKHLFLAKSPHLSQELVKLVENLMLSDNQELHDTGTLLFHQYATAFYKQEISNVAQALGNITTITKQYVDYELLSFRKKFLEFEQYIVTTTRLLKVFDAFFLAVSDKTNTYNTLMRYNTLMKQLSVILNLYKSNEASAQLLYNTLYQQLHQAYTFLKSAGIPGNKLIRYKQNILLNKPLSQTLPIIQDKVLVRQFEEAYQDLKQESKNTFSFLDITKLSSTLKQSHKLPQSKQVFIQDVEQPQTQETAQEMPTEKPGKTATQTPTSDDKETPVSTSSSNSIRDTGRYVIDESHELYIEIYDRPTGYTYVLYRIPELSNSPEKLFQQFEYDKRVTEWFTDPLKRLQEDGYTTPGHKYYTEPNKYSKKILLHAFAPIIDDYIGTLGYISASPYAPQTDKNIRILGELHKDGHPTKYIYFTYNTYKKADAWRCNHRCIEIKPKSEFLATQLEYAKYEVNFPPLK